MAGVGKCMGIMTGAGLLCGAAGSYYLQSKANNVAVKMASTKAKDGVISIGGRKPDGTLWDGKITVDELKKDLNKKSMISAGIMGTVSAVMTACIAALTLLLRGKVK